MYLSYQNGKIVGYTEEPQDLILYNLDKVEETDQEYVLDGDKYVLKNEDWEEKQAQKERERISMLNLTAADVERAIYKAKGLDFEDIVELVKDNPMIDVKALKIELKANNFYRGNPYVEQIGTLLGYTSEDIDFLFKNGELPVKETDEENSEVDEESEEL